MATALERKPLGEDNNTSPIRLVSDRGIYVRDLLMESNCDDRDAGLAPRSPRIRLRSHTNRVRFAERRLLAPQ